MAEIKIIVATQKKYNIPNEDIYLPVFVGAKSSNSTLSYQRDDDGENISNENNLYCELTGVYWAYKNLSADYIGLNHYRRYFKYNGHILTKKDAERLVKEKSIILPKKRNYFIETVYSQYVHAHGKQSIDAAKEVIINEYSEYLDAFEKTMKKTSFHRCNMFIMPMDIYQKYCDFIFGVLEKVKCKIKLKDRILGYLGERLLDVFVIYNNLDYYELPILNTERINWLEKMISFIKRKVTYDE